VDRDRAHRREHRRQLLGRPHPERPEDPRLLIGTESTREGPTIDRGGRARETGSSAARRAIRALAAALLVAAASLAGCERDRSADDTQGPIEPDWDLGAPDGGSPADAGAAPRDAEAGKYSPDAKWETHRALAEDLTASRHPSDGGGKAWLVEPAADGAVRPRVVARDAVRFRILYEAGPRGVAEGGVLFLQPSPFWGWSPPQTRLPEAPGFTEVRSDAAGLALEPEDLGEMVAVRIRGRALAPGERVEITYGAGPAKARVDSYAEAEAPIWIAVDGDGDGVRAVVRDSPSVDVLPGPAARLVILGPSTAAPGETIRYSISVLDAAGNAGVPFAGVVALGAPAGLEISSLVDFRPEHRGTQVVEGRAPLAGVYRIRATTDGGIASESNPLVVRAAAPRILWGDLHGHSNLSDGTGTPDGYLAFARDIARLDVVALTDHDHWGMLFLDQNPDLWERIRTATRVFDEPGRFVTLLGYEWTSWLQGHRHVLYFSDGGEVLSSMDERYQNPDQLWKALAGQAALTFAHHSAGGPVGTNWSFAPDPVLEPVTEVASVHGSSEAWDTPGRIYHPVRGNFVRDALARGYRLGFIGSGDSHDGHPGLVQLAGAHGGLAALVGAEPTREGVLATLRARRVYATNGPRIFLRVELDGAAMGSIVESSAIPPEKERQSLEVRAAGTAVIERIDVVRGRTGAAAIVESAPGDGQREWSGEREIPRLAAGDYLYVRVVQDDGGAAWSSPIYAR
jgi:hypothetical protein